MGDVGSLALGGALGTIAVLIRQEILLVVVGGIFVIETLSVIIQVVSFKLTGQARLPDGADPPSFRGAGLARAEDRGPLLDHLDHPRPRRALVAQVALVRDRAGAALENRAVELAGREVLVLGLGVSGRSRWTTASAAGRRVVAADERAAGAIPEAAALPAGVEGHFGKPFPDLAALRPRGPSPGIPAARYAGTAQACLGRHRALRSSALAVPIVAVTGTNGKIDRRPPDRSASRAPRACAPRRRATSGIPALELVGTARSTSRCSRSRRSSSRASSASGRATAVLLERHARPLDRHGDMAGYVAAKARIFARQGEGDHAIVNGDDAIAAARGDRRRGVERLAVLPRRSAAPPRARGLGRLDRRRSRSRSDAASAGAFDLARRRTRSSAPQKENVLAALLALASLEDELGARPRARRPTALPGFEGLPHRCVRVARASAASPGTTTRRRRISAPRARALESMTAPIVWIAGGKHKGADLAPARRERARPRARVALLIGEAAAELERRARGRLPCERVGELAKAVARAAEVARAGRRRSCSRRPARASTSSDNFEDRGRQFVDAVHRLDATGERR